MKTRNIIAVALFAFAMYGVYQFREWREAQLVQTFGGIPMPDVTFTPRHVETPAERRTRFELEATELARAYITNAVVGFRRIRHIYALTSDPAVSNWNGHAEVEYINQIGGVSTKDVDFVFALGRSGNILYCDPDMAKATAQHNEALARAMGMKEIPTNGRPRFAQ